MGAIDWVMVGLVMVLTWVAGVMHERYVEIWPRMAGPLYLAIVVILALWASPL
jgi:hypothetical protein